MTNEEVASRLKEAAETVASVDLPEEFREIAFGRVLDFLLPPGLPSTESTIVAGNDVNADEPDWMSALHNAAGVSYDILQDIFVSDESGFPLITIDPVQLGKSTAECTRRVALLVAGARQIGNLETATDSGTILRECKRLGVHDQSNHGATIASLTNWFHVLGPSRSRTLQIKPSGRIALRELLADLENQG